MWRLRRGDGVYIDRCGYVGLVEMLDLKVESYRSR